MTVDAARIRAFRTARHHLDARRPADALLSVVGAGGIQNSPPWAAGVSLVARLDGLTPEAFDRAVATDRTLTQSWCMRGAPYFFPTADIDVFTTGLLPDTERDIRAFIHGVEPALARLEMSAIEAVDRTEDTLPRVLAGRRLPITELGQEIAAQIADYLPSGRRRIWTEPGPYAPGQPLGEAVVHFVLRLSTLKQTICFAPRGGNKAPFVLTTEWLRPTAAPADRDAARREFLRRYLRGYGPTTAEDFATWAGISTDQAAATWDLLADELTSVDTASGSAVLLTADLADLESTPAPSGVRLLPPSDPYLHQRDRHTILDPAHHRDLWRTVGAPGAVLHAGQVVGTWNARKKGARLDVTVRPLQPLSKETRTAIQTEAELLAPFRGAARAAVTMSSE